MRKLFLVLIIFIILGFGSFIFIKSELNAALVDRLRGRILLQVESQGEAWYVNPLDAKKYYLGRPKDALDIMRSKGLGINNKDLGKIPFGYIDKEDVISYLDNDNDGLTNKEEIALDTNPDNPDTDGDGYQDGEEARNGYDPQKGAGARFAVDYNLAKRLAGRILLQVESHGEAWYVNPVDNKRYFLGTPARAFAVMQKTALGVRNLDLKKIERSEKSAVPSPTTTSAPKDISQPKEVDKEGDKIAPPAPKDTPQYITVSNVGVINITETSATVIWKSNLAGDSQVRYAADLANLANVKWTVVEFYSPGKVNHTAVLTGLQPGAWYVFEARTTSGIGKAINYQGSFVTKKSIEEGNFTGCEYDNPPCAENYRCVDNECVLKTGCQYNNPVCPAGKACVYNTCIEPQCRTDADCENVHIGFPPYQCQNYNCIPKEFNCDNICAKDEWCIWERCVSLNQVNYDDENSKKFCQPDEIYIDGSCEKASYVFVFTSEAEMISKNDFNEKVREIITLLIETTPLKECDIKRIRVHKFYPFCCQKSTTDKCLQELVPNYDMAFLIHKGEKSKCTGTSSPEDKGRVVLINKSAILGAPHEFGHAVGNLWDEYCYFPNPENPNPVDFESANCRPADTEWYKSYCSRFNNSPPYRCDGNLNEWGGRSLMGNPINKVGWRGFAFTNKEYNIIKSKLNCR